MNYWYFSLVFSLSVQVTIVCHILSLASSVSDPMVPLFSRETIELALRTVVDGFMEL